MVKDNNLELAMEVSTKEQERPVEELKYYEKMDQQIFQDDNDLSQLLAIQDDAKANLAVREGYQNYEIIKVVYYEEPVKLVNIEDKNIEELELSVVIAQDADTLEMIEIYYLDGKEADISELIKKYESPMPIKDLINNEEPDLELYDAREEEELIEIIEFEDKEKEKKSETREENSVVNKKSLNIIQRIDPQTTYVNSLQTVSNAFNISSDVHELVVAYKQDGDKEALSNSITLYMLDKEGNIIEKSNNKTIKELFELDNSTGMNPTADKSTRVKLDGILEKDENRTMARFKSKNSKYNISVDQKETLDYHKVYVGNQEHGNSDTEVEVSEKYTGKIQYNSKPQQVVDYGEGTYKAMEVDEETRDYAEENVCEEEIPMENIDENEDIQKVYNSSIIPGTEITWEELSEKTGESISKLQERFEKELENGKEPQNIIDEIEYDYEMTGHEHRFF